jgi:ferredoxin/coenzyme F420-reducing hydrogenase delta subunit
LAIERVNIGGYCTRVHSRDDATAKAATLLTAAAARAEAFPGSSPAVIKPHLLADTQIISRRKLLTVPPVGYQPVAAIDAKRCVSRRGCDLCVAACPQDAISVVGGRAIVDKHACDGCGLCMSSCPANAVRHPTHSPAQITAELASLLTPLPSDHPRRRAILFVCERGTEALSTLAAQGVAYPSDWLPVDLPRTGLVSATWIWQCLAGGADTVGVADCGGDCCAVTRRQMRDTIETCRALTDQLDWPANVVRHIDATNSSALAAALNEPIPLGPANRAAVNVPMDSAGPRVAARALARLLATSDTRPSIAIASAASPLGVLTIDARLCTLCGSCAHVCPSNALTNERHDGSTSIQFDPAACSGCRLCIDVCPESRHSTIRVEQRIDTDALNAGPTTLVEDTLQQCEMCGARFASTALIRRVAEKLEGRVNSRTLNAVRSRCPTCRGVGV